MTRPAIRRLTQREVRAALGWSAQLQSGDRWAPVDLARLRARFWSYVKKPEHEFPFGLPTCWVWIGAVNGWGYGYFRIGARVYRAHRIAYLLTYGTIPEGALILHNCDNRRCCNPAHLRAGTQSDNVRDEWARYRRPAETLGLLITRTRRNGHAE